MKALSVNRKTVVYVLVAIAFVCLGFFAGLYHEPWADEAQAWLIARDNNSILDIIKAVRLEGTLPTWHLIIKIFQLCGLNYRFFFIIPLILSTAGVLLLFATDAPLVVKAVLPFSFYAVYQNAVVARQYSLVFPVMMLIVLLYRQRLTKPVRFHLVLLILAMTSSYGVIVACSFMLWDLFGFFGKIRDRFDLKYKITFFATGVLIILTVLLSLPPDDCNFVPVNISFVDSAVTTLLFNINVPWIQYVFLASALLVFVIYFRRSIGFATVCVTPLVLYMAFFYHRVWHTTYLFFLLVALMIICREDSAGEAEESSGKIKLISRIYIAVLLAVQVAAGMYSIYTDYRTAYYPSKDLAEFIRPYVGTDVTIEMKYYCTISLQPYFDHNIYGNNDTDKCYYIFSDDYKYELSSPLPDMIVIPLYGVWDQTFDGYKLIMFKSCLIFKFSAPEDSTIVLAVKESLYDTMDLSGIETS